jgi:hypothetical protein
MYAAVQNVHFCSLFTHSTEDRSLLVSVVPTRLLASVHGCSRYGVVTARHTSERPRSAIPPCKNMLFSVVTPVQTSKQFRHSCSYSCYITEMSRVQIQPWDRLSCYYSQLSSEQMPVLYINMSRLFFFPHYEVFSNVSLTHHTIMRH